MQCTYVQYVYVYMQRFMCIAPKYKLLVTTCACIHTNK